MDLRGHLSDRAAVCHIVPFRLWASRGEHSGSKDLWGFCGAREGTAGKDWGWEFETVVRTSRRQVRPGLVTHGEQASSARTAR